MHKITLYTQCDDRPEWLYLRNEIYTNQFGGVEPKNCAPVLAGAAGAYRAILKTNMRIAFATFELVDGFGYPIPNSKSFVTSFNTFDKRGQSPLRGFLLYRDVVRLSLYPRSGRVGHLWLRGCLDSRDVEQDAQIGRYSKAGPLILPALRDAAAAYNCRLFDQMYLLQLNRGLVPSTGETTYYTDSHAQTRWRRRTRGRLVDASYVVFAALVDMADALEVSRYWQGVNVRISPGEVYENLVAAIGAGLIVHQAVEQASKAGQTEGSDEGQLPTLRFGPAWATLIEAWSFAKDQSKKPLEELQKKFPPHREAGDLYIHTDFLSNYDELLEKIIERVALTANADWYNPRAYKGQLSPAQAKRLPDIIELAF